MANETADKLTSFQCGYFDCQSVLLSYIQQAVGKKKYCFFSSLTKCNWTVTIN